MRRMSMRWISTVAVVASVVFWAAEAASGEGLTRLDPNMTERANEEFGLNASELVWLEMVTTPGVSQRISVPFGGEVFDLDIARHSTRSPDAYEVRYARPDGSFDIVQPGPIRTVRGTVAGVDGAVVVGSVDEEGLTAVIKFASGERLWVEPLAGRIAGAVIGDHVVYDASDVIPNGGSCAADVASRPLPEGGPELSGGGCEGTPCVAELGVDSDVEFFNTWGGGVENRINTVTDIMNEQYESDVGITHLITTIIIRTTEPDPYSTNDPGGLLNQFRSFWNANMGDVDRDMAELFTGRDLAGGVIGIAFVGVVCGSSAYAVVQNLNNFNCATDLSAHELGHNWNAAHCSCPNHTMNASLPCANRFHPTFTIPTIVAFRDSRPCLSEAAPFTVFPFSDDFVSPDLDSDMWLNEDVLVDTLGNGEPTEPFSLDLFGNGRATTGFMDATVVDRVVVEYWWQRSGTLGGGGSPEAGEDLVVEYFSEEGSWVETDRQFGAGEDDLPYEHGCTLLPPSESHEGLQVRFRVVNAEINDHFFVDNVRVRDGLEVLSIVTQPSVDQACLGGTDEFSVVAAGDGPFTYQWFQNGSPLAGETNDTLVISPVQADDFTDYSVEVGNACGTTMSVEAPLLEIFPLTVTGQPQDGEFPQGGTIALFMFTEGGGAEYQWFFNGDPIDGANSTFLFIPNAQCSDQGCYHADATNDCGMVTSDIALVTITGCGDVDCADSTPPEIVHGSGLPGETRPFAGYIDPRQESSDGSTFDLGISEVAILFSEDVEDIGGGGLTPAAFTVSETGAGTPPGVASIDASGMPLVLVTLDRPITLQEYTTIQAAVQDMDGNVIVDNGDEGPEVDETDRVDLAFLPSDVDQSENVTPFDLLAFRQIVNDLMDPTQGTEEDFVDTNRDGIITPFDLLVFRQLINGISPATQSWSGATMNNARP